MSLPLPAQVPGPSASVTTDPVKIGDVGFTTLYDGGPNPELDIVFIHGIQGHPCRTWCHAIAGPPPARSKSTFLGIKRSRSRTPSEGSRSPNLAPSPDVPSGLWPAEILPGDFPNARILTYGYDSQVSHFFGGPANQNDIVTIGGGFLNDIAAERLDARKRPLIIVSHSMGGLVTKEALRRASMETEKNADLRDVLESTVALVFFGTPHRGGAYTDLGLTAAKMAKAAGFDVNDRNIRDLKGNSPVLTLIRQSFVHLLDSDKFEISTFQESLGYKGTGLLNGKIVPNESSELDHRNERINLINANHLEMCRFKDKQDDGYRKFKAEMTRHISHLRETSEQKCVESFLIPQMSDRLSQIEEAHDETLGWIYNEPGPGVARWLRSGRGVFWIQGKPGSGKSTAMKFMLQDNRTYELLNSATDGKHFHVIGCFFTDRADRIQASWKGVLHSMIYQLLKRNRAAARFVLPIWKEALKQQVKGEPLWNVDKIEHILRILKSQSDQNLKVCFLIDAIDEHDGNHTRMCDFLHELCDPSSTGALFKVCAASRPENELRDLFRSDLTIEIHEWTHEDIQRYVTEKFSQHPRWQTFLDGRGAEIATSIASDIVSRAKGVFLWVRLIVDELLEGFTNGDSLTELQLQTSQSPDDLKDFFAHIIDKIDKKHHTELLIIIEALLRSRGTLSVPFLRLVILANLQKPNQDALLSGFEAEDIFDFGGFSRRLQSRCRGLVEMATFEKYSVVQFLHQTVKEYFLESDNLSGVAQELKKESDHNGPASVSGHTFLLKGYLQLFRRRDAAERLAEGEFGFYRQGDYNFHDFTKDVIYHVSSIETIFKTSPIHVLRELDEAISQKSACGNLWPFEASDTLYPVGRHDRFRKFSAMQVYMDQNILPPRHYLLMLAVAMGWTAYLEQRASFEDATSIQSVGVRQFSYLCCPMEMDGAIPVLDSARCLVDAGVDVTGSQEIKNGYQVDALGFFVSSHLACLKSDSLHYKAIQFLLERGANPRGKCLVYWDPIDKVFEPLTVSEALISRYGLMRSLSMIELLAAYCPKKDVLTAELFDTSAGKVFESQALQSTLDEDTFTWLHENGAYISESTALLIYRPLRETLEHRYKGERTFSEAVKSLADEGMPDPALELKKSLLNYYIYDLDNDICNRDRFMLEPEQCEPKFYNAAARRLVAEFNPQWSKDEIEAEDSSIPKASLPDFLRSNYWQRFFPTRNRVEASTQSQ